MDTGLKKFWGFVLTLGICGCSTLPKIEHQTYEFPKDRAFWTEPKRPHQNLGMVRSVVNFPTLDPDSDSEEALCRNYFNKSVNELVKFAKKNGGDAVMDVKSVVFLMDGQSETYPRAECSDDGGEGQVLTRGIAIKWLPDPPKK